MAASRRQGTTLLLAAIFAGTVKLIGLKYIGKSAHAAVPATHGVLQEEQPDEIRHAQFGCAKDRRITIAAFHSQAPKGMDRD
jgi:hypothetical protein